MLPKKILLLDTEAVNLEKPHIYDIGYIIAELINGKYVPIVMEHFVISQVYDNKALFSTAYYENKRALYTSKMKGKTAKKILLGHALRHLRNDMKKHEISEVFAYNSPFDKGAMEYTTQFYGVKNPLEHCNWFDLLAIANNFIHLTVGYADFVKANGFIGESGYFMTNAEVTFAYLTQNPEYKEAHLGLDDCLIELEILNECIANGYSKLIKYKGKFLKSDLIQNFRVISKGEVFDFPYSKKINSKTKNAIILT